MPLHCKGETGVRLQSSAAIAAQTQDMRKHGNKSSDMLGGNRADNEGGQRLPPPELQERRGERGSVPWGLGSKADTSKSLHMGNLSGRGTSSVCWGELPGD